MLNRLRTASIERMVRQAYEEPGGARHQLFRRRARQGYGLDACAFPAAAEAFMMEAYRAQERLFARQVRPTLGETPVGFDDVRILANGSEANSIRVFLTGLDENLTLFDVYRERLRPGAVAVDVGGNLGIHACVMSRCVGPTGKVYCYEPRPAMAARAREHLSLNRIDNVTLRPVAVGDQHGALPFNMREDDFNVGLAGFDRAATTKVEVVTLDGDLDVDGGTLGLVKIDAEGMELPVLRGAAKLLARHRPCVVIEFNPQSWSLRDLVDLLPYPIDIYAIPDTYRARLTLIDPKASAQPNSLNLLLVPRGGA